MVEKKSRTGTKLRRSDSILELGIIFSALRRFLHTAVFFLPAKRFKTAWRVKRINLLPNLFPGFPVSIHTFLPPA